MSRERKYMRPPRTSMGVQVRYEDGDFIVDDSNPRIKRFSVGVQDDEELRAEGLAPWLVCACGDAFKYGDCWHKQAVRESEIFQKMYPKPLDSAGQP